MDLAQPRTDGYYSREEFRRWCEAQTKGRYERVDGSIVAMAPERGAHLRVKGAIYRALDRAVTVAGVPCQALPDGATVETGDSDYEPDALVNCGEPMADDAVAAPNPVFDPCRPLARNARVNQSTANVSSGQSMISSAGTGGFR